MLYQTLLKLASFIYPIKYKTLQSDYSGVVELTYYNGKLVLDTANTNYSYGNLQRILDRSINKIYDKNFTKIENILILGVAGGSVIQTLCRKYKYTNTIDAVDIDPVILTIANDFFGINQYKNCNLIIDDAQNYVTQCPKKYGLIIIDLFIDDQIPEFVYHKSFINDVKLLLEINGCIIFNTTSLANKKNKINELVLANFNKNYEVQILDKIDVFNILYIIKKLSK
jgi:spermidine synthase